MERALQKHFVKVTTKKKVAKKYKLHGGTIFFKREYLNLEKVTLKLGSWLNNHLELRDIGEGKNCE